jgi:hypothetical protein
MDLGCGSTAFDAERPDVWRGSFTNSGEEFTAMFAVDTEGSGGGNWNDVALFPTWIVAVFSWTDDEGKTVSVAGTEALQGFYTGSPGDCSSWKFATPVDPTLTAIGYYEAVNVKRVAVP